MRRAPTLCYSFLKHVHLDSANKIDCSVYLLLQTETETGDGLFNESSQFDYELRGIVGDIFMK